MKKYIRTLSLLLTTVLTISLTGCGSSDGDGGKKDFVSQDGHMWYFDGVQYYALPEGYTVKDDGFAYDENGNMFAAGKKTAPYNPADDWGEGWAENWEEEK